MTEHLRFEIAERIATITLDRPERMNAFTFEMIDAWAAALVECRRNDAVRVVIVTGAGKAFCSGGDIVAMEERLNSPPAQRKNELFNRIQRIPLALEDLDKPVLIAVNGVATGAGMDLALMGDIRYAAASARFAETYVKVGLVPGAGGAHFLPRLVGTAKALELFWTAEFVDAAEAERIGLVNHVVPQAELAAEAAKLAGKLAVLPTKAIGLMKRAFQRSYGATLEDQLAYEASLQAIAARSADFHEGVQAFLDKRPATFQGK